MVAISSNTEDSLTELFSVQHFQLFPDNVERLIIDGVVEFSDYYGRWYSNLVDTDKILKYWFDECVAAGPACPMHDDSSEAIAQRVHNVFEGLRAQPLSVFNGSAYGVLEFGPVKKYLFQLLYKPFAGLPPLNHPISFVEQHLRWANHIPSLRGPSTQYHAPYPNSAIFPILIIECTSSYAKRHPYPPFCHFLDNIAAFNPTAVIFSVYD
ncbi:hypothetical protein M422DRAFT_48110 [Sphaerobolus stellatus SS14]|uniref:Uncharacterized protein n=1 Tax=Sphaerobolus stellatus (strain SS14) TaxID=990650 RepID=A0A0C9V6R3_SPHS4|nr:hypothetical protein M422DRAFT_48110 [Sphaerobolus stellatus SS14]